MVEREVDAFFSGVMLVNEQARGKRIRGVPSPTYEVVGLGDDHLQRVVDFVTGPLSVKLLPRRPGRVAARGGYLWSERPPHMMWVEPTLELPERFCVTLHETCHALTYPPMMKGVKRGGMREQTRAWYSVMEVIANTTASIVGSEYVRLTNTEPVLYVYDYALGHGDVADALARARPFVVAATTVLREVVEGER